MNEIEELEINIKNIKDAYNNIVQAMNNIIDIDILDQTYKDLDNILQILDDIRSDFEIELANLQEEAFYKENEEQWKKEKIKEENDYWNSQF